MKLASPDTHSEHLNSELYDQNIAYWKSKLQGLSPLQLNSNYHASPVQSIRDHVNFTIDKNIGHQLLVLSGKQNVTLFTVLLTAFKVMLHRYTAQNDIYVGTAIAGKQKAKEGMLEDSLSTLALRSDLDGEITFNQLLNQLQKTISEALEHQLIPFDKVMAALADEDDLTINPLFQTIFVFRVQHEIKAFSEENIPLSKSSLKDHTSKYDLTFTLTEAGGTLQGTVDYRTEIYNRENIEKIINHYLELLNSIVKAPDEKIGALPMLTKEDIQLFEDFNNTSSNYPSDKTIADLFEEQVLKTPDNVALIRNELTITYRQLNESANKLARYLLKQGVKEGSNVGLLVSRGFNMIIGMYGILKAGGAYIPIDPEYPVERQKYILSQSSASHLIADDDYPVRDLIPDVKFINFNTSDFTNFNNTNLKHHINSHQLAYTIYTSGSTGVPKGVMIEHHSAVNLILWVNNRFNISQHDRVLFITSMCFDLSVYDVFGLLSAGGSVVIANQQEVINVEKLKNLLHHYKITFWDSVPTTMNYLVRELKISKDAYILESLRLVFLSGDWIPVQLPVEIKKYFPNANVISLGGATEGTIWSNYFPINQVKPNWISIPYGKPITNNFFYVLNEQLQPVPPGVEGELHIGGVGVARGYANDKKKTDYSFISDPFNHDADGRMYRTGDLGRMLPDGNLEFLGRRDSQVKIRGYRVELGEIENVLNTSELVSQAVVISKGDNEGNKKLIAFFVANSDPFNKTSILAYLKSKLPEYMIPAVLVELKQLPLTSNGKIDKKALLDMDVSGLTNNLYTAPLNDRQLKLAQIWQEILGVDKIGIHDNFFELGGHSLMAVRMITKLETEIGIRLPLSILFKYPTIHSLLSSLEENNPELQSSWKSLVPIKASGHKMPVYIIHGSGLNVLNFRDIAMHVDPEQPVFGLQAKGLNGMEDPLDDMKEIAKSYIKEILEHNPDGPYAIAGYSFGGYVAVEMRNQLELLGKKVKMLAIFDTNAVETVIHQKWHISLLFKLKKQIPKFLWILKSLYTRPAATINYQTFLLLKFAKTSAKTFIRSDKANSSTFYSQLEKINKKQWDAFQNYSLNPFNDIVFLFRAKYRIYYVNDFKYLGWQKYAQKGVKVYEVPGDHRTMLLPPNAKEFARALQHALDNC